MCLSGLCKNFDQIYLYYKFSGWPKASKNPNHCSTKLCRHCSDKISVTFNGQVRWLAIPPLGEVLPTTNQKFFFSILSPAMFSFMTNISKAGFTNLLGRLLLYFSFSGHRQWVCWYVSLCWFLPNHFWICAFSPSSRCRQQPSTCQAVFTLHGRRATAKAVLVSKKPDRSQLLRPAEMTNQRLVLPICLSVPSELE